MKYVVLTAIIEPEGDNYNALCKELGVASFGNTVQEALHNLQEATSLYLDTLGDYGEDFDTLKKRGIVIREGVPAEIVLEARLSLGAFATSFVQPIGVAA